jgi:hypothetical protein
MWHLRELPFAPPRASLPTPQPLLKQARVEAQCVVDVGFSIPRSLPKTTLMSTGTYLRIRQVRPRVTQGGGSETAKPLFPDL